MPLIDYLVLTALDEEWLVVRDILCAQPAETFSKQIEAVTYYLWKQTIDHPHARGDYLIVGASMGTRVGGESHASAFVTHCLQHWLPARVVMLGIAGSLEPERLKLGDVVFSDHIYGYEVSAVENGVYHYRPTFNQVSALDSDRIRALRMHRSDYQQWQQECHADVPSGLDVSRSPELHIEATASGNSVVRDANFGEQLRKQINSKISAVEMEGRGLYQALYLKGYRADGLMLRGISDFADVDKSELEKRSKDGWRAYAAGNAARLLRALWRRGPIQPLSPKYQLNLHRGKHDRFRQEGIPSIEFRQIGAQHLAFPELLNRTQPTPELLLQVTAFAGNRDLTTGFRGQCIVHRPQREVISAHVEHGTHGLEFRLCASEQLLHVELLLSFPAPISQIGVTCRDDFQRQTTAIWVMPK